MIIFYRILAPCTFLYSCYLYRFRFSVGMLPIWISLFIFSALLSFTPIYHFVFGISWLKNLILLGIVVFILLESLIFYVGHKTPLTFKSDYIIVLGASVKGENMSLTLLRRAQKAFDYLSLHENTIAILSGGQGPGEHISEAEAMKRYLVKKGIPENRLILEDASTSTKENIQFSYELIHDMITQDTTVTIITSHFHIFRSRLIAFSQGKKANGIGAKTVIYLAPNYYLREFFGIFLELFR